MFDWYDSAKEKPIYKLADKLYITLRPTTPEQLLVTDYNTDFWALRDIRIIAT